MTDNKIIKKTLGLKTPLKTDGKKLSVKLPNQDALKVGSKGKSGNSNVVVVMKSRKGGKAAQDPLSNMSSLSEQEKERKLKVLREAKKIEGIKVPKTNEGQSSEMGFHNTEKVEVQHVGKKETYGEISDDKKYNELPSSQTIHKKKIKNLDDLEENHKANTEKRPEVSEVKNNKNVTDVEAASYSKKKLGTKPESDEFKEEKKSSANKKLEEKRRFGRKLSVTQVMTLDQDDDGRKFRKVSTYKKASLKKNEEVPQKVEKIYRDVIIPDHISVQELANRMTEKVADVVKALMKLGMIVSANQNIDADTAEIIVQEFGHRVNRVTDSDIEKELINELEDTEDSLQSRAPVVTIMGHVDHGKTSLLDALRLTDVVAQESGGITQHIGAYKVNLKDGHSIIFLDTPGHEAFTAMRMRGAQVTDIVVIVIAADDGIKEQTIEAINHAKAAKVPIIVAINKIDKPGADVNKAKNSLLSYELIPEDLGGDIIAVEVSALKKIGLEKLEEAITLQAEMLDLKANPNRLAKGTVIEAKVDKGRGVMASFLVQHGTLNIGDIVIAGQSYGRIRALIDDKGHEIKLALPSTPVEVLGLSKPPEAGDEFIVVQDDKTARQIIDFRLQREKEKKILSYKKESLQNMIKQSLDGNVKELSLIVKADVHGSVEAVVNSLTKLSNDEAKVKVLHAGVGAITESDVSLAVASNALIVSFNVRANSKTRDAARNFGITIKYYSIIYDLVDDIKKALSGMLSPIKKENINGYAEVRKVFNLSSQSGKIAGCYITEGKVIRNSHARLLRDSIVVYEGKLKTLKRFKEDAKEVSTGFECGISFEKYDDIKEGDQIECYTIIEEERKL